MRSTKAVKRDPLKELREWKRQALKVLNALDLQEIGKELNLTVGDSVAEHILPRIKKLKADGALAEARLSEARRRTVPMGPNGDRGEINFLPLWVEEVKYESDTKTLYSERGWAVGMACGRRRVRLVICADMLNPPQVNAPEAN